MLRGRLLPAVALLVAVAAFAIGPTTAQDFPSRPVRMIYVFTGGGVSDLLARVTAQKMGESLGQTVIV